MARSLDVIFNRARREAWAMVEREMLAVLPQGWVVWFAVGWGLTVMDAQGETVVGGYQEAPTRLPKGMRRALLLACDFIELFGEGNERLKGRVG